MKKVLVFLLMIVCCFNAVQAMDSYQGFDAPVVTVYHENVHCRLCPRSFENFEQVIWHLGIDHTSDDLVSIGIDPRDLIPAPQPAHENGASSGPVATAASDAVGAQGAASTTPSMSFTDRITFRCWALQRIVRQRHIPVTRQTAAESAALHGLAASAEPLPQDDPVAVADESVVPVSAAQENTAHGLVRPRDEQTDEDRPQKRPRLQPLQEKPLGCRTLLASRDDEKESSNKASHIQLDADEEADAGPAPAESAAPAAMPAPENFSCAQCGNEYFSSKALKQHVLAEHEGRRFACTLCNDQKMYRNYAELNKHFAQEHEISETHDRKAHTHIVTVQQDDEEADPAPVESAAEPWQRYSRYPCELCDCAAYSTEKALKQHFLIEHEGRRFACALCNDQRMYRRYADLNKHFVQKHGILVDAEQRAHTHILTGQQDNERVRPAAPEHFACAQCDRAYNSEKALKQHVFAEHGGRLFACALCNDQKRYRHYAELNKHLAQEHRITDPFDRQVHRHVVQRDADEQDDAGPAPAESAAPAPMPAPEDQQKNEPAADSTQEPSGK